MKETENNNSSEIKTINVIKRTNVHSFFLHFDRRKVSSKDIFTISPKYDNKNISVLQIWLMPDDMNVIVEVVETQFNKQIYFI